MHGWQKNTKNFTLTLEPQPDTEVSSRGAKRITDVIQPKAKKRKTGSDNDG